MFVNPSTKATSLAILVALITTYLSGLSFARTISNKQVTDNESEIRLGFDEGGSEFKRLIRPSEVYENQLNELLLPQKARILVKRSSSRRFQLCGRQLHQMLAVVCNRTGRGKRNAKETEGSIDDLYTSIYRPLSDLDYDIPVTYGNGWLASGSPLEKLFGTSFQELPIDSLRTRRSTSGASTCCRRSCSLSQLRSYCPQG